MRRFKTKPALPRTSMTIREIWRRITATRYTRALESQLARERAHNDRLRAENRALLNSILGIAGVPPLPASADDLASVQNQTDWLPPAADSQNLEASETAAPRRGAFGAASSSANRSGGNSPGGGFRAAPPRTPVHPSSPAAAAGRRQQLATPMRRRSWPQINRMLEFESAKKDKAAADELIATRS